VVLCNAGTANATALLREAMRPWIFRSGSPAQVSTNDLVGLNRTVGVRAADYQGTWTSDEADARWVIRAVGDSLRLSRTAGESLALQAVAADSFRVSVGLSIIFARDAAGQVTTAHVSVPRALNVPFRRAP
jgi:hypothetical protein